MSTTLLEDIDRVGKLALEIKAQRAYAAARDAIAAAEGANHA